MFFFCGFLALFDKYYTKDYSFTFFCLQYLRFLGLMEICKSNIFFIFFTNWPSFFKGTTSSKVGKTNNTQHDDSTDWSYLSFIRILKFEEEAISEWCNVC